MRTSRFLVSVMFATILILTSLVAYQSRVIRGQSDQLRWLMGNCKISLH